MEKLVSIGMTVYNTSEYIEDAIKSILKQTYTNWELIVINDGSTDDTLNKIKKIKDNRIKIFSDSQNKGIAKRLNECIEASSGDYFARMDGDDIMVPYRLEQQVKYLEEHKDVNIVGSLAVIIDENSEVVAKVIKNAPQNIQQVVKSGGYFIHPTVMGHLDWFKKHKYDIEINRIEDFELWVRTFESSNFYILEDNMLFYRVFTATYRSKYHNSYRFTKRVLKKHSQKIPQRVYYSTVGMAYLKYLFFGIFKRMGLLNRKTAISTAEKTQFQAQLNDIIEK